MVRIFPQLLRNNQWVVSVYDNHREAGGPSTLLGLSFPFSVAIPIPQWAYLDVYVSSERQPTSALI